MQKLEMTWNFLDVSLKRSVKKVQLYDGCLVSFEQETDQAVASHTDEDKEHEFIPKRSFQIQFFEKDVTSPQISHIAG